QIAHPGRVAGRGRGSHDVVHAQVERTGDDHRREVVVDGVTLDLLGRRERVRGACTETIVPHHLPDRTLQRVGSVAVAVDGDSRGVGVERGHKRGQAVLPDGAVTQLGLAEVVARHPGDPDVVRQTGRRLADLVDAPD